MIADEIKMNVAENCPEYHSKFIFSSMSLGISAESCKNCINYINGKCIKNLFDGINETIRVN